MIDQNEVVTEQQVEGAANQSSAETTSVQLQQAMWGDNPVINNQQPAEEQKAVVEEKKVEEVKVEQPVVNEWWKNFGWESEDTAKAEIPKLKEVKPAEEIKWANDQSKQLHELIREGKTKEVKAFLEKQEQLEQYTSAEVNPQTAEGILKLQMKLKFPNLKDEQINFQYNEDYGLPSKPAQKADELDEEYSERVATWQSQVDRINMKREIAATMAVPDLQKLKAELVLPNIGSQNPNNQSLRQPTQEEIAAETKLKEEWKKAATSTATEFKGFSTTAKYKEDGKDVEIPVSYGLSDEEKRSVATKLSAFVEGNFNLYDLFKDRWVDKDGNDRVDQMVKDLSWLMYGESAAQKFANEAINQRMEHYLKGKKNIRVDGGGGQDFGQGAEQKSASEKLQEAFWS